ncbi:MAG: tRNA (adenosine(37)-N6)-threonylcarbamoyltransferase complex ATPase subunit type 1 TsaE [Desulfosarcina sp.]|jgi:tRNA threonylcarbamoyladenosine biosynthesis protein TsaE
MNAIRSSQNEATVDRIETRSYEKTVALGCALGRHLEQATVFLLFGDLGSGKTAFAQGLARGLDVPPSYIVTSPTYTLINEYPGKLPFYHVDLYRLPTPVDPDELGLLELFEAGGIVAVEWAQRLHPTDHPRQRIDLHFSVTGDRSRSIQFFAYGLDASDLLNDIDI